MIVITAVRSSPIQGLVQRIFFWPFFWIFQQRKVLGWSSFSYVPGSEIDERGGEEWETKGFTAAVMWGLVEQGGYALVVRITADRMT
jgi:hypothetical protein